MCIRIYICICMFICIYICQLIGRSDVRAERQAGVLTRERRDKRADRWTVGRAVGCTVGWVDRRMGGQTVGRMDGWAEGARGRMVGRADGWSVGWTDSQMGRRVDGQADGQSVGRPSCMFIYTYILLYDTYIYMCEYIYIYIYLYIMAMCHLRPA